MLVSVITALYNEEDSIPELMESYRKLNGITPAGVEWQFVFVNDGSKDRTLSLLETSVPETYKAKIHSHPVNMGFGAGMRTGIGLADGDIIVCYDADSTYPVEDILKLVDKVKDGWDVASANPFHETRVLEKVPLWRQALTLCNAMLYRVALGSGARTLKVFSCSFRAYKRDVVKGITFRSNGFGAASEVLGRLLIKKYKVIEVPSKLSTRRFGYSKMNVRKAATEHFRNIGMFLKIRFLNY